MVPRSKSLARWAGLAVLACVSIAALPENEPTGADTLTGQLLVAAPGIGDPRFEGMVIYLVHHDKDGAFGIAVNRPVGKHAVADLLKAMGEDPTGVSGETMIFAGGPVQTDLGFVIHTGDYSDALTIRVDDRFSMTSDAKIVRAIATGAGPKQSLIAFGYSGWAPGQLEAELARNAWYVTPADAALLFDGDRDSVWQRAFDKKTLRL